MNSHSKQYILVTPSKNEEKNLKSLIRSIANQTIKPRVWVIVDDDSKDRTSDILAGAKKEFRWIKTISINETQTNAGTHYSHVCSIGFRSAIEHSKKHNIEFGFIGLVDADIILENTYFEKLIQKFENDIKLGIASGECANIIDGELVQNKSNRDDLPSGGARIWRKKCFEETGGYILTCAPDSVSHVKAWLREWKTREFKDINFTSVRPHTSVGGMWDGYKNRGKNNHYLGYNPMYSLFKGVKLIFIKPHYIGIAYLYGYFSSLILREKQINDDEIRHYYKNTRPRELNKIYFRILKNAFKR